MNSQKQKLKQWHQKCEILRDIYDKVPENYKTSLRDTKQDLKNWIDIPFLWTKTLNIVKVSFFSEIDPQSQCNAN